MSVILRDRIFAKAEALYLRCRAARRRADAALANGDLAGYLHWSATADRLNRERREVERRVG